MQGDPLECAEFQNFVFITPVITAGTVPLADCCLMSRTGGLAVK